MPPEFDCRHEVIVPASPEEVWEAVATTDGNAAWLFPNPINPDGPPTTTWDPPHRFAIRMQEGDWFNALEFTIEGRDGGTSSLRYVHSGIFVDDWDNQYDAVQQHTDFYLHTLGEYLRHFSGRRATYIGDVPQGIAGPPSSAAADGFDRLRRALGLDDRVGEGDAVVLTPNGLEPVHGVVDYRRPNFMGIRSGDALYCFFGRNAFGQPVGMSIHSFAGDVDPDRVKQHWQNWMNNALA
jgi:uncharacterized protein YndB with AHSA1/START domain